MEQDNKINNPTTENTDNNNGILYDEMEAVFKSKAEEEAKAKAEEEAKTEADFLSEILDAASDNVTGNNPQEIPEQSAVNQSSEDGQKQSSERVKKTRKKKKKRKKNPNWLARIFVAAICLAIVFAILHIDYFTVTEVNVTGNDYLTEKQVLKGSKVKTGNNIFDIHIFIEKKKIGENPYVETVKIRRQLPNVINVEVTEPVGMAQFMMGNKYVVTDNTGKVLQVAGTQQRIPLITGIKLKSAEVGSQAVLMGKQDKIFSQALEIVRTADENDMFFKSLEVNNGRVTAYIFDKLKVQGSVVNIIDSLETGTLRTVVYDLYQKDKKKGTINVSADNYCSFTTK